MIPGRTVKPTAQENSVYWQGVEDSTIGWGDAMVAGFSEALRMTSIGLMSDLFGAISTPENASPLTNQQWKNSPYYREGLEYEEGMTNFRAIELSDRFDRRVRNERAMRLHPWAGFFGGLLGSLPDPINFLPFMAPAKIARLGFVGRAALGAAEAGITEAALTPFYMMQASNMQEEYDMRTAVTNIGFSLAIGGGLGAVAKSIESGLEWSRKGRSEAGHVTALREVARALEAGETPRPMHALYDTNLTDELRGNFSIDGGNIDLINPTPKAREYWDTVMKRERGGILSKAEESLLARTLVPPDMVRVMRIASKKGRITPQERSFLQHAFAGPDKAKKWLQGRLKEVEAGLLKHTRKSKKRTDLMAEKDMLEGELAGMESPVLQEPDRPNTQSQPKTLKELRAADEAFDSNYEASYEVVKNENLITPEQKILHEQKLELEEKMDVYAQAVEVGRKCNL